MSTAEHTDALTRRIEQLAAAALDEGDGAALAALIAALRSEIGAVRVDVGSLRSETGGLRTDLDGLEARVVASVDAGKRETTSLLRRFAGELDETVTSALDDAAQATATASTSLEDARGALESRLAVLEDALDGLSERLEALARDGATTTTSHLQDLTATVRDLDARLTAQGEQSAERVVDRLGALVEARVAATEQRLAEALDTARARAAEDRASLEQLAATAGSQLTAMTEVLDRTLSGLQATVGEQQAGVAALTARFAGLGDELASRLAELTAVVDERTSTLRTDVTERLEQLEGAMGSFRAEWPTRTFEVVQGAKAVAEGVTREVRAQVEVQLDRVRDELARGVEEVGHARDGLDAQSSRLAEAGQVLVAYLEQRDRLLEAERDRVLHDVLDSFATGLSSRERTALASRMGDAVARRRDARDAERYRAALTGRPAAPEAGLPPELTLIGADDVVRALSGRAPQSPAEDPPDDDPPPPEPLRSLHPPSTSRGALAPPAGDPAPEGSSGPAEPPRVRSLSVSRAVAPGGSVVPPPSPVRALPSRPPVQAPVQAPADRPRAAPGRAGAGRKAAPSRAVTPGAADAGPRSSRSAAPVAPLKRPAGAPSASGGRTAAPGGAAAAGRAGAGKGPQGTGSGTPTARRAPGTAAAGSPPRKAPAPRAQAAGRSSRRGAGDRGRLAVMPEVPSVDVALDLGEPVPPELVGVVPVAPDTEPAGPGASGSAASGSTAPSARAAEPAAPPADASDQPASDQPASDQPGLEQPGLEQPASSEVPAPGSGPAEPTPPHEAGSALFARPTAVPSGERTGDEPEDDDDGVRRLFRRRPRP